MDHLIVRLLPPDLRARHGDEIVDMLTDSTRPIRDHADLVAAALGLRVGRMTVPLLVVALLAAAGFAVGLLHAVGSLDHGAAEMLDHWWSTFILAGFATTVTAAAALAAAHRQSGAWRRTNG
jgi:hypothetical protein